MRPEDAYRLHSLRALIRYYVLAYWKAMAGATFGGLVVTGLNLLSLALFAAIPHLILQRVGAPAPMVPTDAGGKLNLADMVGMVSQQVDRLVVQVGAVNAIIIISVLYLASAILIRCIQLACDYVIIMAKGNCSRRLMTDLFTHIMRMSLDFFHRSQVGDLAARLTSDVAAVSDACFESVNVTVTALPLFLFYTAVLLVTSWKLTVAALIILVFKGYVTKGFARRVRKVIVKTGSLGGKGASRLTEVLVNIMVVKAYGMEGYERKQFDHFVERHTELSERQKLLDHLNNTIQTILQTTATILIIGLGTVMMLNGGMQPVTLVIYFFTANRTQEPTRRLLSFIFSVERARGFSVRLLEIAREQPAVTDGPLQPDGLKQDLRLENLSFGYAPGRPALSNINLTIHRGEVIGVVGPSGSGKSTLVQLLLRFQDPQQGRILLDGTDIREFSQHGYRNLFGIVTQEPILFNDTIRGNIRYARNMEEVSDEAIIRAARIAHVDEFAEDWPDGYDTFVGDRGVRLSGGQKQRITLARAVLRNPPILILDEATSSLDSHSERLIQDAINGFLANRTAIIVAHRLSTVRNADRIIVLKDGQLVEEGTHEALMALGGAYHQLHVAQMSGDVRMEAAL